MALIKFLFLVTTASTHAAIRPGVIREDHRLKGIAIGVINEIGLKSCGRQCIYQKQCEGISYSMISMQCILMTSIKGVTLDYKYVASIIAGWEMDADPCSRKPCAVNEKCVITKTGFYCAKHIPNVMRRNDQSCRPNPCLNGGHCKKSLKLWEAPSFHCHCLHPFIGEFCRSVP